MYTCIHVNISYALRIVTSMYESSKPAGQVFQASRPRKTCFPRVSLPSLLSKSSKQAGLRRIAFLSKSSKPAEQVFQAS